jgi:hypothetical protein
MSQVFPFAYIGDQMGLAIQGFYERDVFLVIFGWPTTSPDESFAETYVEEP